MSNIFDSQLRRPIVSYTPKMTLPENSLAKPSRSNSLPQAIFGVQPKASTPTKEAIQNHLADALGVIENEEESSDNEEGVEVELSDESRRPLANSAMRRELLNDNMEMLSKHLSMLEREDFSESCDEEGDFHDGSIDVYGF